LHYLWHLTVTIRWVVASSNLLLKTTKETLLTQV
jgi:hypothetical protein